MRRVCLRPTRDFASRRPRCGSPEKATAESNHSRLSRRDRLKADTKVYRAVRTSTILVILIGAAVALQAQAPDTPDAVARALQKRYDGIRDFSADFVHTYRGGVLKTETREQGTVSIKKPGLMHWIYMKPERKEFVSDGHK